MLKKLFFITAILSSILFVSCSPKHSEIVVAEYGDYNIKMDEFEKAYAKNIGSYDKAKVDSAENYKKFLDLYVNFKMKLRDAKVRQIDKDESIIKELNEYERTIGTSYILEKELYEQGILDLYKKRAEEIRVSHLLIRTDTLSEEKAYAKALAIIDTIKKGASFEEEVQKHTDDQFSRDKGGDIYYFTGGMIMPEFEDLAYDTPVGEVNPTPLKTKYGFHIIKLTEKIKRIPQIKASHILLRKASKPDDVNSKKEQIDALLSRARSGEDFGKLAAEFSEDPGSKQKNGDLGFFTRRQMVQPFDEAVFNLKVGEISDIVETQFGYHIIKVTDVKEYPSYEEEKSSLRELYEKTRKSNDYEKLLEKYSVEAGLVVEKDIFNEIIETSEPSNIDGYYWERSIHKNYGNRVLFSIKNEKFTVDSIFTFGLKDTKFLGKPVNINTLNEMNKNYQLAKVLEVKALELMVTDKKFAGLMEEYKNGILIFKLQEDEVWNKMRLDSIAIFNLYEKTKENYVFPDRVQYNEIFTKTDSLARNYLSMLKNGYGFDSLSAKYNEQASSKSLGKNALIDVSTNELSKEANNLLKEGDVSDVIKNKNGWSIVKLIKKDPSRIKTFEEARAEVTSAYQDLESTQLENSYVNRLKNTYQPSLFYEELENAYKN